MSDTAYESLIANKLRPHMPDGIRVSPNDLTQSLFALQSAIVRWQLRMGRSACFADTGLGKSRISLEVARQVVAHTGQSVLIYAPLAVGPQTIEEGQAMGNVPVTQVRYPEQVTDGGPGIYVVNYDRFHLMESLPLGGLLLDESAILRDHTSKTREAMIAQAQGVPFRGAYTATPAPNDIVEIGNTAEFLGVSTRTEMLATYFVNSGKSGNDKWKLRGHATEAFWRWLASWAVFVRKPSDLGFSDEGYLLPPLEIRDVVVQCDTPPEGMLFATGLQDGIAGRSAVRKSTLDARIEAVARLVEAEPNESWILWTGLNSESDALEKRLAGITSVVRVEGKDSEEEKVERLRAFRHGEVKVLISKSRVAGAGLNLQVCARQAFVGMSDCYDETTEILTRRGWLTFGQLTNEDEVATANPESLAFEWQKPTHIVWEHYDGEMISFRGNHDSPRGLNRSFDLLVTPNHRMFARQCPVRYINGETQWHFMFARDLQEHYKRMKFRMASCCSGFVGQEAEFIEIPDNGCRLNTRSRNIERVPIEDFMALAGWYLSEGYCRPMDSAEAGRIVICQTEVHPEHRAEIISLLQRIGLHVNDGTKDITCYSKRLAGALLDWFGDNSNTMKIPTWVKDLAPKHLLILMDKLFKGDGCHKSGRGAHGWNHAHSYRTNSKQLADDVQEVCIKLGVRASVRYRSKPTTFSPMHHSYEVRLARLYTEPYIYSKPQSVDYSGMVGCVGVPNGTVIVRRNGIPVISGNSFADFYQSIRRSWRFGQTRPVHVYIVVSEAETAIVENVRRKEEEARKMSEAVVANTGDLNKAALEDAPEIVIPPGYITSRRGDGWLLHHGDCIEVMRTMEENSVDLSVFSPPFEDLYVYSDNARDLGNSTSEEFWGQFHFFVEGLLRVVKPGRIAAVHVAQLASTIVSDGVMGLKDFRGRTIDAFEAGGWVFHGDVPVRKDPQGQAIRTHAHALLFKSFEKDRTINRPALADYFLFFKKPGRNAVPVAGGLDRETWIRWANSVWTDIRESYTLNAAEAKGGNDSKHLCPLQLDAISRCVQLWSNPGEVVFTPFLGCGSEVYQALLDGRQAIGIELKPEYFRTACVNARRAEVARGQQSLFACAPETTAPTTTEIPPEWIREALGAVYRDITEAQKAAMELRAMLGEAA